MYVAKSLKGTGISVLSQELFEYGPLTRVDNLKVCSEVSERYRYINLITSDL